MIFRKICDLMFATDSVNKEGKPQKVIVKEAGCSHSLYPSL